MRTLEKEGKTIDEAIWKGLQELNLTREKVRIEILDHGSKGIFGLGARPAKVLLLELETEEELDIRSFLRSKDDTPAPKPPARDTDKTAKPRPKSVSQPAATPHTTKESDSLPASLSTRSSARKPEAAVTAIPEPPQSEAAKRIAEQLQRPQTALTPRTTADLPGTPRPHSGRNAQARSARGGGHRPAHTETVLPPTEIKIPQEGAEAELYRFLSDLFQAMQLQCSIGVTREENLLQAFIYGDGQELGLLIGKHGATLDALQYLASLVVNRRHKEHLRVQVHIGDYRKRREETLQRLAERVAAKVMREGKSSPLEPMSASERRLIHLALQDHPRVQTTSEGEEPNRRVVILPRGKV